MTIVKPSKTIGTCSLVYSFNLILLKSAAVRQHDLLEINRFLQCANHHDGELTYLFTWFRYQKTQTSNTEFGSHDANTRYLCQKFILNLDRTALSVALKPHRRRWGLWCFRSHEDDRITYVKIPNLGLVLFFADVEYL